LFPFRGADAQKIQRCELLDWRWLRSLWQFPPKWCMRWPPWSLLWENCIAPPIPLVFFYNLFRVVGVVCCNSRPRSASEGIDNFGLVAPIFAWKSSPVAEVFGIDSVPGPRSPRYDPTSVSHDSKTERTVRKERISFIFVVWTRRSSFGHFEEFPIFRFIKFKMHRVALRFPTITTPVCGKLSTLYSHCSPAHLAQSYVRCRHVHDADWPN